MVEGTHAGPSNRHALVTGLLVVGLLPACEAAEKDGGPDPDERPTRWPRRSAAGRLRRTSTFTDATPRGVAARTPTTRRGDGRGRARGRGRRASRRPATPPQPTLAWTWPLGEQEWAYRTEAALRLVDDEWQAVWTPTLVEPSLKGGEVLDSSDRSPPTGARSSAPAGRPWSTDRPVDAVRHRPHPGAGRRGPGSPRGSWPSSSASTRRRTSSRSRPPATRRSSRRSCYRRDEVPPDVDPRLPRRDPRRASRCQRRAAAGADPRVRGADPRHGRRGDRRDDRGGPRQVPGRRRGRAVRPPGAVRRPAARHSRRGRRRGRRPTARSASCSAEEPHGRAAAGADPRRSAAAGRRAAARRRRPGQRAGRDPAVDRRHPGRGERARHRRLQHGDLRPVRAGLDVQEREQPGPAAGRADPVVDGAVHRPDRRGRQARSRTTTTTRPAGSAGSRCARRWRTPATPPSSPRPASSPTTALVDAAASLGMGVDHDLGFPAYFGSVEPPASETEAAADMIGQGTILASPMVMATVIASIQSGEHGAAAAGEVRRGRRRPTCRTARRGGGRALRAMLRGVVTSGSGEPAGRRTRAAGDRQDRHRRVRARRPAAAPTPG